MEALEVFFSHLLKPCLKGYVKAKIGWVACSSLNKDDDLQMRKSKPNRVIVGSLTQVIYRYGWVIKGEHLSEAISYMSSRSMVFQCLKMLQSVKGLRETLHTITISKLASCL